MHYGIDIAAPEGTMLISIMDGEVVSCGWRRSKWIYNNYKKFR